MLVTDFIRKYSGGQIAPPTLNGKDLLSTGELEVWNKLLKKTESGNNNETHFKSVYDALKKVLDNYNTNFKETLEELIKNSNSEEINNFKMIQENKLKIQSKWDAIHQRCENYISSAIATYFVNDEVYKSSLDFIKELLVILIPYYINKLNVKGDDQSLITFLKILLANKYKACENYDIKITEEQLPMYIESIYSLVAIDYYETPEEVVDSLFNMNKDQKKKLFEYLNQKYRNSLLNELL